MGNKTSKYQHKFVCHKCHLILEQPVMVPCQCISLNICKKHLIPNAKMYECELCKTKLNVSLIEFKENLILKEQIEKSLFLKPNMRTLKSSLDAKLDEIEDHLRKMNEASEGELLLKICEHFEALKNEIDIKREIVLEDFKKSNANINKIEEIHILSSKFIECIETTQQKFIQNFSQELKTLLNFIQLDNEKQRLKDSMQRPLLTKIEMEKLYSDFSSKLAESHIKFGKICSKLDANLKLNRFEEHLDQKENFGNLYLNTFQSNLIECQTKKLYTNGDLYFGSLLNGKRNGKGNYIWANGDTYDGEWLNDQINGKGKYLSKNGNTYDGDWINYKRSGNGKSMYTDGDIYEGEWLNDQKHGKGIYFWENGDSSEGSWVNS